MMEFVNGKDDIPYMKWKLKAMFQTTNINDFFEFLEACSNWVTALKVSLGRLAERAGHWETLNPWCFHFNQD